MTGEDESPRRISASVLVWPMALAVCVYLLTSIPYWEVASLAPVDTRFVGQIANGEDINAYFSFIRQAAKGQNLFVNTMTYQDQEPRFFNLEFWVVGKLMPWLASNTRLTFEVWRFAAALLLLGAFTALAHFVLRDRFQRNIALIMAASGSALGAYALSLHPFGQILQNPHLAVMQGLWITVFACLVVGERNGRVCWYLAASLAVAVQGLCGPQFLVDFVVLVPIFIVLESILAKRVDWRRNMLRLLPALVAIPLILYYARLSTPGDIVAFLASRGYEPALKLRGCLVSLGLAGVLLAVRIVMIRRYPLATSGERLLLVWALVSLGLVLFDAQRLTAFPLDALSVAPVIVLGVGVFQFPKGKWLGLKSPRTCSYIALFLLANSIYSIFEVQSDLHRNALLTTDYVSKAQLVAFAWLNQNAKPREVIAAPYTIGNLMGQYVNIRKMVGHRQLTPGMDELITRLDAFLRGEMKTEDAEAFIDECRIRYIFTEVGDGSPGPEYFTTIPEVRVAHDEGGVTLYSVEPVVEIKSE